MASGVLKLTSGKTSCEILRNLGSWLSYVDRLELARMWEFISISPKMQLLNTCCVIVKLAAVFPVNSFLLLWSERIFRQNIGNTGLFLFFEFGNLSVFFKLLSVCLQYDPEILLQGIIVGKMKAYVHKNILFKNL